ncbi:MAG: molybdopterin molybdotransferase MoeA [Planctomycetia bacterium]|nr:molybdopterin molybdotransferase MoeA [Planctomycetia bacterium]
MLPVAEAQAIILRHTALLPAVRLPLTTTALGLVLAEDVASDLDMPPYDKSMMDGYAVRCADLPTGQGGLQVIEEVTAGRTPTLEVGPGQATRIMTGAPVPVGADAVIPVERTHLLDGGQVRIDDRPPTPGKNILPQGREMRRGDSVLSAGTRLGPAAFGILATVGRTEALLQPRPGVAILSTGDEVVEAGQTPGPGQIRNSNGPMLAAQVARAGGEPRALGIGRDRVEDLRRLITEGLREPVLILSGGVSAGKLDLVPGVLQELGVQAHFHKVEMKPGKPMFFGTVATGPRPTATLVFGLPGNPVSSLVCFELFVRPALRRLQGREPGPRFVALPLAEDFPYSTDRPTYYPARLEPGSVGWSVRPLPWFGSADLRALAPANALVLFPAGEHQHRAGERFPVLRTGG